LKPKLKAPGPIKDPGRFERHEVKKGDHYYLSVDAVTKPMEIRKKREDFEDQKR
jgi:hypothetical protein